MSKVCKEMLSKEKQEKLEQEIKELFDKYKYNEYNEKIFNEILNDISEIDKYRETIKQAEEKNQKFREEKKLTDPNIVEDVEFDFEQKIKDISKQLANCEKEIDDDERNIDDLEDNKAKLLNLKEEISKNNARLKILNIVKDELSASQSELDKKYVAPIMNQFSNYETLLGNILDTKIEMGKDFNISLDIYGEKKSYEHLSSGQRSICALCFRLALLDNIYNKDIPFIIMDDPFINLDKKNLTQISIMLEKLSKDKQIIYFSCHESRKI